MPRANRNFLPGHIWHITQRCHKREFLLKFQKDKRAWIRWALEAKRRFGLTILNFVITSNHIHLLAMILASRLLIKHLAPGALSPATPPPSHAPASVSAISSALQLVESRVAQEFNMRKERSGAFWEGRYHATAVENGLQLMRCLTYIDMNMVRAGVVEHPRDWAWSGYYELGREPAGRPAAPGRHRVSLVDTQALMDLLGVEDAPSLLARRTEWIDAALRKGHLDRDPLWTESVAVGSEKYLRSFQGELASRSKIGVAEIELGGPDGDSPFLKRTRGNPILFMGTDNDEFGP